MPIASSNFQSLAKLEKMKTALPDCGEGGFQFQLVGVSNELTQFVGNSPPETIEEHSDTFGPPPETPKILFHAPSPSPRAMKNLSDAFGPPPETLKNLSDAPAPSPRATKNLSDAFGPPPETMKNLSDGTYSERVFR